MEQGVNIICKGRAGVPIRRVDIIGSYLDWDKVKILSLVLPFSNHWINDEHVFE